MTENSEQQGNGGTRSKIIRVIEKYGIEGFEQELETRWLAEDEQGMSLRELAEFFNKRVLEAALERSELSLLDTDLEAIYRQLTDESVSAGERTRLERRLDRNGVDADTITSNFVTHQTVYTYLRNHRNVSQPEESPEEKRAKAIERVQKLQNRTGAVTESTIESLQRDELVPNGEYDVLVNVQIVAEDGKQYTISELVDE